MRPSTSCRKERSQGVRALAPLLFELVPEVEDDENRRGHEQESPLHDMLERTDVARLAVFPVQMKDRSAVLLDDPFGGEEDIEYYGIAMAKDNTELLEAVNKALADMKAEGFFDELDAKYAEE